MFHLDRQRTGAVRKTALPDESRSGAREVHSDKGRQKVRGLPACGTLGGDHGSQGRHLISARRAERMADLHVILCPRMSALPRLDRPGNYEMVQLPRKIWEQTVRQPDPRLDRAHIKIRWRPFAFFEIEGVELTGAAVQEKKDAVFGSAARGDILFGDHVDGSQHGRQPETGNRHRAGSEEVAAGQRELSGDVAHYIQ